MQDSDQPRPADHAPDDQDAGRTSLTRMFPLHLGPAVPPADASAPRGEDAAPARNVSTTAPGTPDR